MPNARPGQTLRYDSTANNLIPTDWPTERISVMDDEFGAKGDDATDEILALEAARDSVAAKQNPTIYLPGEGRVYRISRPFLNKRGNINFLGEGGYGSVTIRPTYACGPAMVSCAPGAATFPTSPPLRGSTGYSYKSDPTRTDWLNFRESVALDIDGLSQFTVEFDFKPSAYAVNDNTSILVSYGGMDVNSNYSAFEFSEMTGRRVKASMRIGATVYSFTSAINLLTIGTKITLALCKNGTDVWFFADGVIIGHAAAVGNIQQSDYEQVTAPHRWQEVGEDTITTDHAFGDYDCIHFSNTCRHTAAYTPSSSKPIADANTLLLANFMEQHDCFTKVETKYGNGWLMNRSSGWDTTGNVSIVGLDFWPITVNQYRASGLYVVGNTGSWLDRIRILGKRGLWLFNNTYLTNIGEVKMSAGTRGDVALLAGFASNDNSYDRVSIGTSGIGILQQSGVCRVGIAWINTTHECRCGVKVQGGGGAYFDVLATSSEDPDPTYMDAGVIVTGNSQLIAKSGLIENYSPASPAAYVSGRQARLSLSDFNFALADTATEVIKIGEAPLQLVTLKNPDLRVPATGLRWSNKRIRVDGDVDGAVDSPVIRGDVIASLDRYRLGSRDIISEHPEDVLNPTGGTVVDVQCRATLAELLKQLRGSSLLKLDNVAATSYGSTATASSQFTGLEASKAINGDRKGLLGTSAFYWNSADSGVFPQWLKVTLPSARLIYHVYVYSLQNDNLNPVEPDSTMLASVYGLIDFDIEYLSGAAWVRAARITGNTLVKRKVTMDVPFISDQIRIVVNSVVGGDYARVVEFEAMGRMPPAVPVRTNVALASRGATATASSSIGANVPANAINGNHLHGGGGGIWNDGTEFVFPDDITVTFDAAYMVEEVIVYSYQDGAEVEPDATTTFSVYGITSFQVQTWDGSAWVNQATITGNNKVKKSVTFTPVLTTKIKIIINATADGEWSRVVEVEAFAMV